MLRGNLPRSPVWLRKIPSTVSGSQGSRRGLRPAVRFAFPLGARLNITLRARPCQELFFRKFLAAVPRAAGRLSPSGPLPFAATSSVLYAPPPRRGRETLPHTGCRQLRRGKAERGWGDSGREGAPAWRFAPPRSPDASPRSIEATAPEARGLTSPAMHNGPGGPALARLGPPGGRLDRLRSGARPAGARGRPVPAFGAPPPKKKDGRLRSPPAFRAGRPSATVPGRFSLRRVVSAHFNIDTV